VGDVAAAEQGRSNSMTGWRRWRRNAVDEVRVGEDQQRLDLVPGGGELL
jgi:hypothetical protein